MNLAYRQQDLDEDAPRSVMLNDHSAHIADIAGGLAEAGREDDEAVAEVGRAAEGHRDDLKVAALSARQGGLHHQSVTQNRMHRLLQAALHNTPVAPPAEEDRVLLDRVATFEAQADEQRWAGLVRLEPRLAQLEDDVASGRLPVPQMGGVRDRAPRDEAAREQSRDQIRMFSERLGALVGPTAETDDSLLRTQSAHTEVFGHLLPVEQDGS